MYWDAQVALQRASSDANTTLDGLENSQFKVLSGAQLGDASKQAHNLCIGSQKHHQVNKNALA